MTYTKEELRAAAQFEATNSTDTISHALHRRELAEKDATIKALADALETQMEKPEGEHLRGCPHSLERYRHVAQPCADECVAARNALRLAGRLP